MSAPTAASPSLYDMANLLLTRIKDQEPALAGWTNAPERFPQMSDPGVLMLGLKGFVQPYHKLLEDTSKRIDRYGDWADRWDSLVDLLRDNLAKTGISAMIEVDWDAFRNEVDKRQARFETISVLLRRLLLGVDWLEHWQF